MGKTVSMHAISLLKSFNSFSLSLSLSFFRSLSLSFFRSLALFSFSMSLKQVTHSSPCCDGHHPIFAPSNFAAGQGGMPSIPPLAALPSPYQNCSPAPRISGLRFCIHKLIQILRRSINPNNRLARRQRLLQPRGISVHGLIGGWLTRWCSLGGCVELVAVTEVDKIAAAGLWLWWWCLVGGLRLRWGLSLWLAWVGGMVGPIICCIKGVRLLRLGLGRWLSG